MLLMMCDGLFQNQAGYISGSFLNFAQKERENKREQTRLPIFFLSNSGIIMLVSSRNGAPYINHVLGKGSVVSVLNFA